MEVECNNRFHFLLVSADAAALALCCCYVGNERGVDFKFRGAPDDEKTRCGVAEDV